MRIPAHALLVQRRRMHPCLPSRSRWPSARPGP
jgi:hypothetical protein